MTNSHANNDELSAYGWNLDDYDLATIENMHSIYIRDFRNGFTKFIGFNMDEFNKVTYTLTATELAPLISNSLIKEFDGTFSVEDNESFKYALCGYIKDTNTYQSWARKNHASERMHYILNVYKANDDSGMLRPLLAKTTGLLLTLEQMVLLSDQGKQIDFANHPEWFKPSKTKKAKKMH